MSHAFLCSLRTTRTHRMVTEVIRDPPPYHVTFKALSMAQVGFIINHMQVCVPFLALT